ncbi:hypothetical protein [Bradyrhizobium sp. S3.7.6]
MSKYQKQIDRHGRSEIVTDVRAFASDLAKALKGGALNKPREDIHDDKDNRATFMLGADLIIVTGNRYGSKGRVSVYIEAPEIKHADRNHYSKDHKCSDATVSPDARSIDVIAKDIKKRVIDASQAALKLQREYAAIQVAARNNIVEHMHQLSSKLPGMNVHRRDQSAQTAGVSSSSGDHYVSGTLNSDGTVSISHIGSMSMEKFVAVMNLLKKEENA